MTNRRLRKQSLRFFFFSAFLTPVVIAQMRHREEPLYDDGGGTSGNENPILFLLFLAFMIWVLPFLFKLVVALIVNFWTNIKKDDSRSTKVRYEYVDGRQPRDRSDTGNVSLKVSMSHTARDQSKTSVSNGWDSPKTESIRVITLYPWMLSYALERVEQDFDASFYLLGENERPVIAWFAYDKAADFSQLPIRIGDLSSIFGYHKDVLGGGEDQVSFKVFAETVRTRHKLDCGG
jgi:hypothetical protein